MTMGDLNPEEDTRQTAGLVVSQEDPWAVIDRVQAAFADVPVEEIEAEFDRAIAEIRAEARARANRD
jgi:hypothetical protein